MPNNLIDDLLKAASPTQPPAADASINPASEALRSLTTQIDSLRGLYQTQTAQTLENTAAVVQNTGSRTTDFPSRAADVAKSAVTSLGGGLTFLPLISGIAKLLGFGSDQQELPALTPFALPGSVSLDGAVSQSGSSAVNAVSYGQNGLPRTAPPSVGTNISLNIQTMDSRSFLDHSDEIARAVREAMLNSHPVNDVIAEI